MIVVYNLCSPFIKPCFNVELRTYQNRPVAPAGISGISVGKQRGEVAACVTLDLHSFPTHNANPCSAVRIPRMPSVHNHKEDPAGTNVLDVDAVVSGAAKRTEYIPELQGTQGVGPIIDFRRYCQNHERYGAPAFHQTVTKRNTTGACGLLRTSCPFPINFAWVVSIRKGRRWSETRRRSKAASIPL
jgi:hypothetical protein